LLVDIISKNGDMKNNENLFILKEKLLEI
jgi:hypothetical protein